MGSSKDQVAGAITRAQDALAEALVELARVPAFNSGATAFVAHILNNYLTVTHASITLLQKALAGHPDEDVHRLVDGLEHTTQLMAVAVARLDREGAEAPFRSVEVNLHKLTQRAVDYYRQLADRKQIRIDYESLDPEPVVWTDGVKVAAVLDNLLSNAIKYSLPAGRVIVRLSALEDGVRCEVRDHGPGLSAEDQARLFGRGVLLTPRPTGGEPSRGYGLAVAKELIDLLGGTIGCDSAPGRGSCFWLTLPNRQPEPPAPAR